MRAGSVMVVLVFVLIMGAIPAQAQNPLVCGQATGNPAPEFYYVPFDDPEENVRDFNEQIVNYLNATGSIEGLQATIKAALDGNDLPSSVQVIETDLTGDRRPDVLVNKNEVYGKHAGFNGVLAVFTCTHGSYQVLDSTGTGGMDLSDDYTPTRILFVTDLNNNGQKEIVVDVKQADGTRDWLEYHGIQIYEWQSTNLKLIYEFIPADGAFSSVSLDNRDDDPATLEMVIDDMYGYGESTLDPEETPPVSRTVNRIVGWDGKNFTEQCRYFTDVQDSRVDVLQSAETLWACGRYEAALKAYQEVYDDRELRPWWGDGKDSDRLNQLERDYLGAFAGYRLLQIYLVTDIGAARAIVNQLKTAYPSGSAGYQYAAMAQSMWDSYDAYSDMTEACETAKLVYQDVHDTLADPGIAELDEEVDGKVVHHAFYEYQDVAFSSDPDAIFDVPPDVSDMVQIPMCLTSLPDAQPDGL